MESNVFYNIVEYVLIFFGWTFVLYWIHRLGHILPYVKQIHYEHHRTILRITPKWHWSNLFLFNDNWISTIDLWITEVIPTLLFSYITGHWWVAILYYLWAALVQERIEHNSSFNWPILSSGKKHLAHHKNSRVNFGLFTLFWDWVFGTKMSVQQ